MARFYQVLKLIIFFKLIIIYIFILFNNLYDSHFLMGIGDWGLGIQVNQHQQDI